MSEVVDSSRNPRSAGLLVWHRELVNNGTIARLTSRESRVLLVLIAYANSATGELWPSVETIARHSGLTRRNAQQAIAKLTERAIVETIRQGGGRGNSALRRLRFTAPTVGALLNETAPNTGAVCREETAPTACQNSAHCVHETAPTVGAGTPQELPKNSSTTTAGVVVEVRASQLMKAEIGITGMDEARTLAALSMAYPDDTHFRGCVLLVQRDTAKYPKQLLKSFFKKRNADFKPVQSLMDDPDAIFPEVITQRQAEQEALQARREALQAKQREEECQAEQDRLQRRAQAEADTASAEGSRNRIMDERREFAMTLREALTPDERNSLDDEYAAIGCGPARFMGAFGDFFAKWIVEKRDPKAAMEFEDRLKTAGANSGKVLAMSE